MTTTSSRKTAVLCLFVVGMVAGLFGSWIARGTSTASAVFHRPESAPVRVQRVARRLTMRGPAPNVVATALSLSEQRARDVTQAQQRVRRARQRALQTLHADLWLHGVGAQLYSAGNHPVTLKAINWYGFEYAPFVPGGLDHLPLDTLLSRLKQLGFNALRMQFADATVEWNPVVRTGLNANPGLQGMHSLDIMGRILERAHHFGLRVILVDSRAEPGMGPERRSGLWYTRRFPESSWRADWLELARRFQGQSALVGVDLWNEPHATQHVVDLQQPGGEALDTQIYIKNGPMWGAYHGTYYHDIDWHYAAQTLGNQLLAVNPHLLIVVEGVQLYYDPDRNKVFGGLWGSDLIGVQYDPIVLSHPSQLVYSAHEYGPQMFMARWFNRRTTYGSLARRWDSHWGYLLTAPASMRAPLLIGEVGTCNNFWACISSGRPWRQGFWWKSFVRYLLAHPQVGWAYWSLNPIGPFYAGQDNFYSLVTHDWRHVHPMLLRGLKPLLAEGT